ncbi:MAG TPA: carbamoyl-phosphate synthase (glutamine-hydrolyzing) large subunit [Candidatus Aenigmarchaeota archaeon]|nr:MAG: carbamoyl phosphate synthase large subunit [Candidatus Aenigmarchaeota archaeon]HDD46062.1 carbamoyl-phosphate synthase (glutamine-hydrolyzing) large subunit [Candidatus Aenigmarchaeota archaeon]
MKESVKKVLVIGSGGIRIGQAAEFDYSGSQALKALREEGIKSILINPNVATIQTSYELADKVYLEPITPEFVEKVIERERPDAILLGFGGQTALNVGVKLYENGILNKYGVKVIGTPVSAIAKTESREEFKRFMKRIGIPTPPSASANSIEECLIKAEKIGYPVIVRPAYILGGLGSGVAWDEKQLREIAKQGIAHSMIKEVLIEKYLYHWKEVEYEVVRDKYDNCITVCNMENIDPMGIHTGDSIVVAPSQTLTNEEYHMLRSAAIKIVKSLGIVGECNVQFALNPKGKEYYVIEVNARLSRSSALASKATGYPLAYIAAKLALGYRLSELKNMVTLATSAFFEPALDYVVIKMPKWEFRKFGKDVSRVLTSQMKSVGEVMAIAGSIEEAIQKAVRMLGQELCDMHMGLKRCMEEIKMASDKRIFAIAEAMVRGVSVEKINEITGIDKFFLYKIKNIADAYREIKNMRISCKDIGEKLRKYKRLGFSDKQIAKLMKVSEDKIRGLRKKYKIIPAIKQIDTLAAEYPARTNYLYVTYNARKNDVKRGRKASIIVLGAGPITIGSSVEFDWCTVNCIWELRKKKIETIVVNCNPETVSTDYDTSDKLYFEELTLERVLDIVEFEKPLGVIVSVGGQVANNLAYPLAKRNVTLLGTFGSDIDCAENRHKFSRIIDKLGIKQPAWRSFSSIKDMLRFSKRIGYPVIIRPSYVLSGTSMFIARNEKELLGYVRENTDISKEHPAVISKFIEHAREVEVDGVCDGKNVFIGAVIEHIENAGVHSGDASMVIPTFSIGKEVRNKIVRYTKTIARELSIKGPFNIQYLVKNGDIYVIECNLRASRSLPFVSKVTGVNLIRLATRCMLNEPISKEVEMPEVRIVGVKMPMFSWSRFDNIDPVCGVEMKSTGEVACLGKSLEEALLKAIMATECVFGIRGNVMVRGVKKDVIKALTEAGFNVNGNTKPELIIDLTKSGELRKKFAKRNVFLISNKQFLHKFLDAIKARPLFNVRDMKEYWRENMSKELKVGKIAYGSVIDHIAPGKAFELLEKLRIRERLPNSTILVAVNVPSKKYGMKDIVKIEGKIFSEREIKAIKEVIGKATINIINNFDVIKKIRI